jgi:hypothetical protein
MITQEQLKERIDYNPLTGVFVWKRPTYKSNVKIGSVAGCIDKSGYKKIAIEGEPYMGHRLAWLYVHGEWPDVVDHINGVRDDNRITNLRNVSYRENSQNREIHRNNGAIPGVFPRSSGRWQARIGVEGVLIAIGTFNTKDEAYSAYLDACKDPYNIKKYPQKHIAAKMEAGMPVGVNYNKANKNYNVEIKLNGKRCRRCGFKTIQEAVAHLESVKAIAKENQHG